MTEPKTIRLTVVIPDPGEWCCKGSHVCPLWSEEWSACALRRDDEPRYETLDDPDCSWGYRRPRSCKSAERKT